MFESRSQGLYLRCQKRGKGREVKNDSLLHYCSLLQISLCFSEATWAHGPRFSLYIQMYIPILMWMHLLLIALWMIEGWNSLYLGQHLDFIKCWMLQQMKEFKDEIALLSQLCFLPLITHLESHVGIQTHCSLKWIMTIRQNNYHCSVTFYHHLIIVSCLSIPPSYP